MSDMGSDGTSEHDPGFDAPAHVAAADQFAAHEMNTPGIVRLERTGAGGRLLNQFYGPFDTLFQARLLAERVNATPSSFGVEPGVTAVAFPLHGDLEDRT